MEFRLSYGKQTILNQALWCVYTGLQRTQRTLTRVSESTSGLYMILFPTLQHLYIFCIYFCMVLSRNPWRISVFTLLGQKKNSQKNYLNFYLLFSFHWMALEVKCQSWAGAESREKGKWKAPWLPLRRFRCNKYVESSDNPKQSIIVRARVTAPVTIREYFWGFHAMPNTIERRLEQYNPSQ